MKSVHQWLNEYGESHRNETNKMIHWICVPAIFFSITGLLYCIKLPGHISQNLQLNVAMVIIIDHNLLPLAFDKNWNWNAIVWNYLPLAVLFN